MPSRKASLFSFGDVGVSRGLVVIGRAALPGGLLWEHHVAELGVTRTKQGCL